MEPDPDVIVVGADGLADGTLPPAAGLPVRVCLDPDDGTVLYVACDASDAAWFGWPDAPGCQRFRRRPFPWMYAFGLHSPERLRGVRIEPPPPPPPKDAHLFDADDPQ